MSKPIRGTLVTSLVLGDQSIATIGYPVVDTLKASLLYWDRTCIGLPTRNFTDDLVLAADHLKSFGEVEEFVLQSTKNRLSADQKSINIYRDELNARFGELRARHNEQWAFLPASTENEFRKNYQNYKDVPAAQMRRIIEIALLQSLPMPDRQVSFEDILEFKKGSLNRDEEIRRLHDYIDDLAGLFATDSGEAVDKAILRLRSAITDLERVYSERWQITTRKLLKAAFVATGAGAGVVAGNYLDNLMHAPTWATGALGATITTFIDQFSVSEPVSSPAVSLAYALEVKRM